MCITFSTDALHYFVPKAHRLSAAAALIFRSDCTDFPLRSHSNGVIFTPASQALSEGRRGFTKPLNLVYAYFFNSG